MKQELWFPTPIWFEYNVFNNDQIQLLKNFVQYINKIDKGRIYTNVGGWQSNFIESSNYNNNGLDFFIKTIMEKSNECFSYFCSPIGRLTESYSWINVNLKNHYNQRHHHGGSKFSSVFYLTEGSKIRFFRPSGELDYYLKATVCSTNDANDAIVYNPRPNMLLCFPSFLEHSVDLNETDNERISIAFNLI